METGAFGNQNGHTDIVNNDLDIHLYLRDPKKEQNWLRTWSKKAKK